MSGFTKELQSLINKHSMENDSNTPDFILAEYLWWCLRVFNNASLKRELWYGKFHAPGGTVSDAPIPEFKPGIAPDVAAVKDSAGWKPQAGQECEWFHIESGSLMRRIVPLFYDKAREQWVVYDTDNAIYVGVSNEEIRPLSTEPPVKVGDIVKVRCKSHRPTYGRVVDVGDSDFIVEHHHGDATRFSFAEATITHLVPKE